MEHFSRRRCITIPAPSVSYSVHEVNFFASTVSASFLNLIYNGVSTVVHLLLLKFSMVCTFKIFAPHDDDSALWS